ncbi:hypothetical protein QBC34DRAFT_462288 [Podospora aff. communis PSN243]|uniref:CBM1 domain-containing protein n=1 Tax=Podospora aff. communis PSN243 TaxID=3040156 RepID=A0AAV9GP28_9PEZI|nr:hypothetical protein QBC34DRAFT_462288 [Podospora aff. communis PSN243]
MAIFKSAILALTAFQGVLSIRDLHQFYRRDGNEVSPHCTFNPSEPESCIVGGKFVKPDLNISDPENAGNQAYVNHLPHHTFDLSEWTNNKIPEIVVGSINVDGFQLQDFSVYNITYSDCASPWVIVRHKDCTKTKEELADVIGQMPAGIRQATSTFLVYPQAHGGAIGALAGYLVGKDEFYFQTALVHELGHSVDGFLVSPNPNVISYSDTSEWRDTVIADDYTATAYGTGSHAENFADIGRVVLINNIYPGGMLGLFPGHPNLGHISNSVALFGVVAGQYYQKDTTCQLNKKYPFPTVLADVPMTTQPPTNTATATPYGQCGGWSTYVGPTLCGSGYSCTTLNPHYAQCTPAPVRRGFTA